MATTSDKSEETGSSKDYKVFLKKCLGGSPDEIEERDQKLLGIESEIFAIPEAEKEESGRSSDSEEDTKEKNNETVCFAMDDSDDDGDDDDDESEDWDLEDAYNFDPERVAELLQRGNVTEEELVETIQVGMAEAMIQRLAQEDPEAEAARPDCQGDLTGRMTPPAQPTAFDANTPPDPKELANKLEKVPGRARRSSMVRRGALDEAARSAAKNHRKSIAGIQKSKLIDDDANKDSILQAVANTRKRNRLSICKAVETLEAAGLGDEPDKEAVAQQLEMVQKCLLEARKKHRDTVAKVAMETVSGGEPASKDTKESKVDEKEKGPTSATTDEKPKFQMSASAKAFNPNQQSIEEKIRSAVKAAHQRAKQERGEVAAPPRGHDQWGNPYAAWGSGYDQTGYGYAQAYHPGYNQANAFNQCYDPSWNNQMGYAQGQHWQQPQQAWTQAGAGQNCWVTPEGATAAYGGDCYNYYGGNYSGYGQHQVPIQQAAYSGQAHWHNAAWGAA